MTSRPLTWTLLAAWTAVAGPASAADDLPGRVRAVFADKCASCHGPDLPKPKGKFGYVTDLARLAANRKLVVPSKPDESHLWELVEDGEMPPEDSRVGALTVAEMGLIRDWIASGAPADTAAPPTPDSIAPAPAP